MCPGLRHACFQRRELKVPRSFTLLGSSLCFRRMLALLCEETWKLMRYLINPFGGVTLFTVAANAKWSDVGVSGKQMVRDLWRQKDLGQFENEFHTAVPRHGVVLVRLRPV